MTFGPVFQRPFGATFDRRGAVSWWLSGGVAAANVVAVYQPKGAASLAASYVNLANPGTYDAALGVAPTLNASGWAFNGTTQYLTTGIVPVNNQAWSAIIRFADLTSSSAYLLGNTEAAGARPIFGISPRLDIAGSNRTYYANGDFVFTNPYTLSGVLAIAGAQGYLNGLSLGGSIPSYAGSMTYSVYIGGRNAAGSLQFPAACTVQAVAIYNTTITAPQVAAVSAAMAAL